MSDEENAGIAEESRGNVTGEVVDTLAGTPGQWMPIAESASRLACSQRTIWRLISRGKLRRRGVGGRAEVFVPADMRPVGTPPEALVPASPASMDTVTLAVIEELKRRDVDQAERLLAQAETIGRLTAERDAQAARADAAEAELAKGRRWWRRLPW